MNRLLTAVLSIIALAPVSSAEEQTADSAAVYFRQSMTALNPDYKDNSKSLSRLATELADSSSLLKKHIRVVGSASPEGSVNFNEYLSRKRATKIFDYFSSRNLIPADSTEFVYTGRNWRGLRSMVEADNSVPSREDV
ncbi:MAG: OmpA family protein, partial [Duncaniella sp.]|nr:OmpA family protein [Duncaniella sp.]